MAGRGFLLKKLAIYGLLGLFAVYVLIPLYWMIVGSLQPQAEMFSAEPLLVPSRLIIDNYLGLFRNTKVLAWFFNSLVISAGSTAVGLFISTLTGFLFCTYTFRFKNLLFWMILASVTIPEIVLIIPTYRIMINLKMINTYLALILPYAMSVFGIFFMKQFMQVAVPRELVESARVEGAGEFFIFWRIAIPPASA